MGCEEHIGSSKGILYYWWGLKLALVGKVAVLKG
jgi:hypothetical protein